MKKTLHIFIVFLSMTIQLNAQCLNSKAEFENYFLTNISNLDPIEGIWSMSAGAKTFNKDELFAELPMKSQLNEYAIIKDGSLFKLCKITGTPMENIVEFRATANQSIYLFKRTKDGEITTANAIMTSIGLLEFSYETGEKEFKKNRKEKMKGDYIEEYEKDMKEIRQYRYIKTYPTQETFHQKQKSSGTGFAIASNGLIVGMTKS